MNEKLPTIRCTGYPLSYVEASNWYRVLYGGRKKWPLFGLAAMGVIAFEAWLGLMFNSRTLGTEGAIGLFFLFACSMTALLLALKLVKAFRSRGFESYALYAYDRERHRFGTEIIVTDEAIAVRSLRGTISMPFSDVQSCVETEKGFALTDGRQWIILRSADMTAALAALLSERFFLRIDRKVIRRLSMVYPQLQQPLPLMNVPQMAQPLATATTPPIDDGRERQMSLLCAAYGASLGGVAGVMVSCLLSLTPWPLVDMLLFIFGIAALMWLITLTAMVVSRPKAMPETSVRFYNDGLSVTADDVTRFYPKHLVTITVGNGGVYMRMLNQQTLFIPFEAADDAVALRRLLGVAENGQ